MDSEYVNCYLIDSPQGPLGIVWADTPEEASELATIELEDAGIDSAYASVRSIPNHNIIFGEED